ncbi:MAG: cellulase family glycosylhydrolase [Chloroflexota bacterium]
MIQRHCSNTRTGTQLIQTLVLPFFIVVVWGCQSAISSNPLATPQPTTLPDTLLATTTATNLPTSTAIPAVTPKIEVSDTPTPLTSAPTLERSPTPSHTATPTSTPTLAEIASSTPIPTTSEEDAPTLAPPEATEEVISPEIAVSCTDIDANWGLDWPNTITILETLITANQRCGEEPLTSKLYAAHFTYGASLENSGDQDAAISQYQAALLIDPHRKEAQSVLTRLDAIPEPTPPACQSDAPPLSDPAPAVAANPDNFVKVAGNQLLLNGEIFKVKGVNYYPREAPWYRFIEDADPGMVAEELDVIKAAGFNTIRIFLRYEPLFTCQPDDAIPNEAAFAKVDHLFQLARDRDLKLIVTLNDLPDLVIRPLYTDWSHYEAQTVYIVRRYRNEPHILAWDLRNEGDLDYGIRPADTPLANQDDVIAWLAHISQLVRTHDPHHLLTAGWWGDPTITSPYVDILSFHHWAEAVDLQARINDYSSRNSQPLMLQEVGYHSWATAPHDQRDEAGQADILGRVLTTAETADISGWVVWTAFDFVPNPGQPDNHEHFFGLWRTDLTPKPALNVIAQ